MQTKDQKDLVRIDRWLWAVRICKTRPMAADLCKRQRVSIDGQHVKPSREVKLGQTIALKRDGITWQYKVLKCITNRVGAKLAVTCVENLTEQEELDKLKIVKTGWTPSRVKGQGRPTKKERRALDVLRDI